MRVTGEARLVCIGTCEFGHEAYEFVSPVHWLNGAQAQARQSRAREDVADEVRERIPLREFPTPAPEVNARKNQLIAAGVDESLHLAEHRGAGQALGRTAGEWNNAERAAIAAALLDLEVGPRLCTWRQ